MKNPNKEPQELPNSTRSVILHYHFFKNAGTSIDSAFKSILGNEKWATREFVSNVCKNRCDVRDWIEANYDVMCFSSHTALLPPPAIKNTSILPVIFIRHPIDRIASVYSFERAQDIDSYGANLAKKCSFAEYVDKRLSRENDFQCRNFHTHRLCLMDKDTDKTLVDRAKTAIDSLEVIGLVEAYEESLKAFNAEFKKFKLDQLELKASHKNATRSKAMSLEQKIEEIRKKLGPDIYNELLKANREDLSVYKKVAERYRIHVDNY